MGTIIMILVVILFNNEKTVLPSEKIIREKSVEVITFGEWKPTAHQEVLAIIESDKDSAILAKVSGTIENTFVQIGDFVQKGQALASFVKSNDITQINYENALRDLETTKFSANNNIQSAKIVLETAKRDLVQAKLNEDQNYIHTYRTLETNTVNSETLISTYLNWADSLLGVSEKYKNKTVTGRDEIGANDRVGKQNINNAIEALIRNQKNLSKLQFEPTEAEVLDFAETRLALMRETRESAQLFDNIIHNTSTTIRFVETTLEGIKTKSSSYLEKLNGGILDLENKIETAKSQSKVSNLTIAGAENRVRNTEASYMLAEANAEAKIAAAQNQLRVARNTQKDLTVRAPFHGKIAEKTISAGDQVSPGTKMFSIVSEDQSAIVVVYLTTEELSQIKKAKTIKMQFEKGNRIELPQNFASVRIDPKNQKIRVESPIQSLPEGVLIGSYGKVLLPLNGEASQLIPVSAISFEPGGAEVLVINNQEGTAERKKLKPEKLYLMQSR